jgi:hypothetical protein
MNVPILFQPDRVLEIKKMKWQGETRRRGKNKDYNELRNKDTWEEI